MAVILPEFALLSVLSAVFRFPELSLILFLLLLLLTLEATRLMMLQSSTFVDGEKKLKAELKKVMERQAQGKDLGIKVASRWEDGVPVVYPGEKHVN